MNAAHIELQDKGQRLLIKGDLNFASVVSLWDESLPILKDLSTQTLTFDLSQVKTCNSAGLALLIEWIKSAKQAQKAIQFLNIPGNLAAIIKLADIGHLVPGL